MKHIFHVSLILITISLSSCMSGNGVKSLLGIDDASKHKKAAEKAIVANAQTSEVTKQLALATEQTTDRIIEKKKEEELPMTPELTFLDASTTSMVHILGYPLEPMPVLALLEDLETTEALAEELSSQVKIVRLQKHVADQKLEIAEWNVQQSKTARGIFSSIKAWAGGLSGLFIILIIVGCIFFPALTVPFVSRLISGILGLFPRLIGIAGMVGAKTFSGVVHAVEEHKKAVKNGLVQDRIKDDPDDTQYSKRDVERLLQATSKDLLKNLSVELDRNNGKADRKIIAHMKEGKRLHEKLKNR